MAFGQMPADIAGETVRRHQRRSIRQMADDGIRFPERPVRKTITNGRPATWSPGTTAACCTKKAGGGYPIEENRIRWRCTIAADDAKGELVTA